MIGCFAVPNTALPWIAGASRVWSESVRRTSRVPSGNRNANRSVPAHAPGTVWPRSAGASSAQPEPLPSPGVTETTQMRWPPR